MRAKSSIINWFMTSIVTVVLCSNNLLMAAGTDPKNKKIDGGGGSTSQTGSKTEDGSASCGANPTPTPDKKDDYKPDNGCINVLIKFGRPLHDSTTSTGHFYIRKDTPTPTLATPQCVEYALCTVPTITEIKTADLPAGVACNVTVKRAKGYLITYQFKSGESIGYPIGEQIAFSTTLNMVDSNGNPTTSSPVYYDQVYGKGDFARFSADTKKIVSITDVQGKVITSDNIGAEIIRTSDGILRQVCSVTDGLADLVATGASSFEIRLYAPSDVGTKGSDGLYVVTGSPHTVWQFSYTEASTSSSSVFTAFLVVDNEVQGTYCWKWNEANQEFDMPEGGDMRQVSQQIKFDTTKQNGYYTKTTSGQSGETYKTTMHTKAFAWGEMTVENIVDPDGLNLVTSYYYYENSTELGRYGHLKATVNPDGSWAAYDYDAKGRTILEVTPWLDQAYDNSQAVSTLAASGHATYYDYSPLSQEPDDTTWPTDRRARVVEEKIQGISVGKTYYVYKRVDGCKVEIVERCASPSSIYGQAGNQRTTTTYYSSFSSYATASRLHNVIHTDGTQDTYTYQYGMWANGAFAVGGGNASQTTVTHGTVAAPNGIANKTTKEVTVEDGYGRPVLAETYVCTGESSADFERISWSITEYDAWGNPVSETDSNGKKTSAIWKGGRKTSETTADGIVYSYTYDSLGRIATQKKIAGNSSSDLTTTFTYDALDRVCCETVSDGTTSLSTTSSYDAASRLLSTTDHAGLITNYCYFANGRTTTVVQPGGGTVTTAKFIDGRTKSISGSAASAQSYDYGVNADSTTWNKNYAGAAGAPMWQKTTDDFLGRTIFVEQPTFNATTTVVEVSNYDNNGNLVKKEKKSNGQNLIAPTIYVYDELGGACSFWS